MTNKPRLLDLFCGAGGAAMGYYRAGFEVIGVDINCQPNYPFKFFRMDAVNLLNQLTIYPKNSFIGSIKDYSFVHCSPPCQRYSIASKNWNGNYERHPDLIAVTRWLLQKLGVVYVIENVAGSPLIDPITLCGTMFTGIRVIRHRLFESNIYLYEPNLHPKHPLCYTKDKRKKHYKKCNETIDYVQVTGGGNCSVKAASDAMKIDWMTKRELNESIPPAYTEWIGKQLIEYLHKQG